MTAINCKLNNLDCKGIGSLKVTVKCYGVGYNYILVELQKCETAVIHNLMNKLDEIVERLLFLFGDTLDRMRMSSLSLPLPPPPLSLSLSGELFS